MATEAALRGDGCRFVVRIECYSSPQLSAGTDANFLTGEVELNVGSRASFQVRSRVVLRVEELMDFRDQLKALDRDLDGEVTLSNLDSDFQAHVRLAAGKGTLDGIVREWGTELRFSEVRTDQTFIREALREFEALVSAFPMREGISD
jgi:hypothetical protein